MELGNFLFGNSRGEHRVDRGLQDHWHKWMEKLGFDSYGNYEAPDGDWSWGFENDVFSIQPYYWGYCNCGYEERELEWTQAHQHREACYQTEYRKITEAVPWTVGGRVNRKHWELVKALLEKHELPVTKSGSAVHCTCQHQDEWKAWSAENSHTSECAVVQPNFLFKPTGFTLDWYKYPLRDSYSSKPLTKELIDEMFAECERSLREG